MELDITPNSYFFTYDAVEMYPSIPINLCLARLRDFFSRPCCAKWFTTISVDAVMDAIELVLRHNIMRLGDVITKMIRGIAMGTSLAATVSNIFMGSYEADNVVAQFKDCAPFLRRFIDDGLGKWERHPDHARDQANWSRLKGVINASGLRWIFSERSKSVVFMDMTISIVNGKVETSLYSKPLNLYLYIPSHSCHAPGVLRSLLSGMILRIYQLCSKAEDIDKEIHLFISRVLDRGYDLDKIKPLIVQAIHNAESYTSKTKEQRDKLKRKKAAASKQQVYLHLPFHPSHPVAAIRRAWNSLVWSPPDKTPFNQLTANGSAISVKRMVMCYHRSPNLGNLLSCRKVDKRSGPKVSSYLD